MQEIRIILEKLEQAGIPYCIVGGLAAIAYGRPRLTLDAGLVVALSPAHVTALAKKSRSKTSASHPARFF